MSIQLLTSHWHGLEHEPPYFYGTDSRELYEHNLRVQPKEWSWRDRPVRYTVNSQGYRCPEWDRIDWANSILMFGCSYQFAPGVDDSETMSHQLSKAMNLPVVNLGQGATDDLFQWANSTLLYSQGVRPRAVVYLWPGQSRLSEFTGNGSVRNWGPWNAHLNPMAANWIVNETHTRAMLELLALNVELLWDCPVLQYYAYNYGPESWGRIGSWGCVIDQGRDLGLTGAYHPGPETLRGWALDRILPDLIKLGVYNC